MRHCRLECALVSTIEFDMPLKPVFAATAIALTIAALLPYIRAVVLGRVQAHVFSWVIWGSTTFVVFLAQLADHGGIGAWPIGVSGSLTILIAFLAYQRRTDLRINRSDWFFFVAALSTLPLWYLTANPLWAVVVLTIVDLLGFGPTLRKVYSQPHSESAKFFGLFALRNLLVILALEHYSLTTLLFPATIGVACILMMTLMVVRRRWRAT
jgi:hypothetical protein